ncbi:type IV pilin protein [Acinetobacter boissieri]|uniref:Type IV pilus assembly protein PilE n=1 Tax=Acinetobacter boissieri TaxID=1219383 RepID=A0A1G6HZZ2_9GAMM|nr:prepilin-type N-terminal cleavage/methylation domain-containing protein [Acinetobacter boissieri]SDB99713.1 type IV pilus assembly protein PilE [Acinetobacter boissieri]
MIIMRSKGFTLIEMMIVVVIVAILVAVAIPSYQSYVRTVNEGRAIQAMQNESVLLERYKARNFSYINYSSALSGIQGYTFTLTDQAGNTLTSNNTTGSDWSIIAQNTSADSKQASFLITSNGTRCKNTAFSNISKTDCGTGAETW